MECTFKNTKAYKNIMQFIKDVTTSIKTEHQNINIHYMNELCHMHTLVTNTPLSHVKGRYANPNARIVYDSIQYKNEYMKNSWGNSTRLDYGTGHELNFLCYCYTQVECGTLKHNEVLHLFVEYHKIACEFINKFNLEPAGSKGTWTLDHYMLLTFVFGSAQACCTIQQWYSDILHKCKSVFVSTLRGNNKEEVSTNMILMYDREVLSRHVVTKSFIYSECLPR